MYLGESAIDATLSVIGGFALGSEIVVDYMLPRQASGRGRRQLRGPGPSDSLRPVELSRIAHAAVPAAG